VQNASVQAMISPVSVTGRDDVLSAIRQASAETGTNFDYLLNTAMRESSLQCTAKSKTSSACGLFQFVDQTWLGLVKRFGSEHGLSQYSDAITQDSSGHYSVASADTKQAILALRQDPKVSSLMAGEAANESQEQLSSTLGHKASSGELYLAHFLGMGGAKKLIAAKQADPSTQADQLFPQAASANHNLFYHADGTAKTVGEVYSWAGQSCATVAAAAPTDADSSVTKTLNIASAASARTKPQADMLAPLSGTSTADIASTYLPRSFFTESWTPGQSPSFNTSAPPSSNLLLTPGVLNVLAMAGSSPHRAAFAGRHS
jgi:hypothetical protein